ncbi:hypothetical protein [Xanthomarina spongicola]|uniref:Uncharacterized protein n=1 Tax=Xanthomarina spongicola TaxID=570520 RepID=A0A316E2P3_9FLAO|nr:hypothetical protein [Xanthomarina spongicola]PWK17150.1 hypothetical protein LX78_02892 [Xanthomarina spongicola]
MKKFICLLLLISIAFVSCDGRKTQNDLLNKAITEFNNKEANLETFTIYPREYTEVITDTLISNKVNVRIKNFTSLNETVLIASTENQTSYHRVFKSEISIKSDNKNILKATINAEDFANPEEIFWNNATLQQVWVNQDLTTVEEINLDMSFINPLDKSYKLYRMSVNQDGQQQINLIEEQS